VIPFLPLDARQDRGFRASPRACAPQMGRDSMCASAPSRPDIPRMFIVENIVQNAGFSTRDRTSGRNEEHP
jgi:hypothetical protein